MGAPFLLSWLESDALLAKPSFRGCGWLRLLGLFGRVDSLGVLVGGDGSW